MATNPDDRKPTETEGAGDQSNEQQQQQLDPTKTYTEGEVQDLLKALKSEREARKANEKALREKAAQLEQLRGIDPETYASLQAESAKRAELEAELAGKVGAIEKTYSEQLAAAKREEEAAKSRVAELQAQWAFERVFNEVGGRGGEFTELAFSRLKEQIKLEPDGSIAVVDKSGAYVLDEGKRIDPKDWLAKFKGHQLLGYCFQPERGAGSGLVPHPGTALANGADMHSLSTPELFAQAFGRKRR